MKKGNSSRSLGQKSDEMSAMDQGTNLISQTINNMTGIDKGNDGKKGNQNSFL